MDHLTMTSTSSENAPDHDHDHDASSPAPATATAAALPPMIPACDPHDGPACLELIEVLTTRAAAVQRRVLAEVLAMNTGTDYLRRFLGDEVAAAAGGEDELAAAFKERVPVVEYEDVKPYIERIANGAPSSLISSKPITELLTR